MKTNFSLFVLKPTQLLLKFMYAYLDEDRGYIIIN